jgi:hypothetical protein
MPGGLALSYKSRETGGERDARTDNGHQKSIMAEKKQQGEHQLTHSGPSQSVWDLFDFIWYTTRQTPVNYALLSSALNQSGPWMGRNVRAGRAWCLQRLQERIESIDWKQAREDVRRFVKSNELPSLALWSSEFFLGQAAKL